MRSCTSSVCDAVACRQPPESPAFRFDKHRQTVEDAFMRSGVVGFVMAVLLASCATTPPVQEMADARSAIQAAREIPRTNLPAELALKSAEQMLSEAAEAIRKEHYEQARQIALAAKRKAQSAVQYKQKP